jgi:twitching motility two-component system response regulator PilG
MLKVLIVEDTKTIATLLKIYLMGLGVEMEVLHAENGKLGLSLAKEKRPDIIISDVQMPEMDGFQLCAAIRSDFILAEVPFIFLTSLKDEDSQRKGRLVGASAFLHKPLSPQGLRERLEPFLKGHKPASP